VVVPPPLPSTMAYHIDASRGTFNHPARDLINNINSGTTVNHFAAREDSSYRVVY
jgi:hypothetical protein